MHRECRERFPRHRLQRKPLVSDPSDPSMHHGMNVTHVPWYMSGSLTRRGPLRFVNWIAFLDYNADWISVQVAYIIKANIHLEDTVLSV